MLDLNAYFFFLQIFYNDVIYLTTKIKVDEKNECFPNNIISKLNKQQKFMI